MLSLWFIKVQASSAAKRAINSAALPLMVYDSQWLLILKDAPLTFFSAANKSSVLRRIGNKGPRWKIFVAPSAEKYILKKMSLATMSL